MTECMNTGECQGLSVCSGVSWHAGNTPSHLVTSWEGRLDAFAARSQTHFTQAAGFLNFSRSLFFNFKLCPESLRKLEHLAPTSTCVEYAAGGQLVRRFKLQTCNRRLFFLCVQKQKATVRTRARTRARPGAHISDTVRMTEAAASVISGSR